MEVTAGPVMLSLSLFGLVRLATGEVGWEGGSCVVVVLLVVVVVVGGGVDSLVMI